MSDTKAVVAPAAESSGGGVGLKTSGSSADLRKRRTLSVFDRLEETTKTSARINPFVNHSDFGARENLKIFVMSLTIAPVRLIIEIVLLLLTVFFCFCAAYGLKADDLNKPLPVWRRALRFPAVILVRMVMFVLGFYWIKENGSPASMEEAPVAISNHVTFLDPLYFYCTSPPRPLRPPRCVACMCE